MKAAGGVGGEVRGMQVEGNSQSLEYILKVEPTCLLKD